VDYQLEKFEKHNDDRGQLVVFLRNADLEGKLKQFGQIYFVTFDEKNIVRGNHYHIKWREWFGVVSGRLQVYLEDVESGETASFILDGDSDSYTRLEVGPKVAHTFVSLSKNASLLNYANNEWEAADSISHEIIPANVQPHEPGKNVAIHKEAIVETPNIGENSRVWANVHILGGATIGKNANICDQCFIENDVTIGDNVTIKSGVYIWDGISIEDNVMIGPAVAFTNDRYPRSKNKEFISEKTILKKGCSVGANATILMGVVIGEGAMVGAGSVVTKSVPPFSIVYGNPALFKGNICFCGLKVQDFKKTYLCPKCGRHYTKINDEIKLS